MRAARHGVAWPTKSDASPLDLGPRRIGHRAQIQAPGFRLWRDLCERATDEPAPGQALATLIAGAASMEIFDYDNILLLPRKCRVQSRSECDPTVQFGPRRFKLPVVPANMKTVVDEPITEFLAANDYFYVMHRFDIDNLAYARQMRDKGLYVSISSGVKEADRAVIDRLASEGMGADYITIDIAHGHADSVHRMIDHIKTRLPQSFVIAGNVATPEAVIDLENWGADATKVGVGPGKVCITKLKTGFGTGGWQLSALKWCARVATKPIIADGGIRDHGDIAKSVRFGASMVMIGSLFAGHEESPGRTVEVDGMLFKEYYGSASDFNKGEYKHVEGKRILEPIKGRLADTLREMREDVQSSISYGGGTQLFDIRKVNYVILGGDNAGEHLLM
jgi:GMP reductase